MPYDIIDELPLVDGYNLPELTRSALRSMARGDHSSSGTRSVRVDSVIYHRAKLNKCFRLLEKYGVVENKHFVNHSYGANMFMDIRKDYLDRVAKDMELPEWDVRDQLVSEGDEFGMYQPEKAMRSDQFVHFLYNPDQYLSLPYTSLHADGEKQYLPKALKATVSSLSFRKRLGTYIGGNLPWVAKNLFGLHYVEMERYGPLTTVETHYPVESLLKAVEDTEKVAETHTKNLPFFRKMAELKEEHGEELVPHLVQKAIDFLDMNATSLINEEGELGEIVQDFLRSAHLVEDT